MSKTTFLMSKTSFRKRFFNQRLGLSSFSCVLDVVERQIQPGVESNVFDVENGVFDLENAVFDVENAVFDVDSFVPLESSINPLSSVAKQIFISSNSRTLWPFFFFFFFRFFFLGTTTSFHSSSSSCCVRFIASFLILEFCVKKRRNCHTVTQCTQCECRYFTLFLSLLCVLTTTTSGCVVVVATFEKIFIFYSFFHTT